MKKKFIIGTLALLSSLCLGVACEQATPPTIYEGEKIWGDNYTVTNPPKFYTDDEITMDGVLGESFWATTEEMFVTSLGEDLAKKGELYQGFQDGSLSIKTYFGEQCLYFGIEVKDPVLYKTNDTSSIWKETCLEFYVATPQMQTIEETKQLWLAPDGYSAIGERIADSFRRSTARNIGAVATIDGDGLCKENNEGYTLEGVISWEDLGLKEKPEYIRLYPCMVRVKEIPYLAGSQQQCWHNVADAMGSTYGVPKSWLKFKDTVGFEPRPKQQDISTYDPSAFANYPAKTVTEYNGDRSLSYNAYYTKGEGIWVNATANHDTYGNEGSFAECSNFEVQIEGKQAYIYNSSGMIWSVGFDEDKSMMWTVENEANAPTKYTSHLIGFIPEDFMLSQGITQAQLDRGWVQFLGAFKTAGENATFDEGDTPLAPDWWRTPVFPLGEKGFFVTGGETQAVQFTDSATKKAFTYSATLNEYGLYLEADVKTDSTEENAFLRVEFTTALYTSPLEQFYGASSLGNGGTYKVVRRTKLTAENKAKEGYSYHIRYYVFLSYEELKNLGVNYGYNKQKPIESSIYINAFFKADTSDIMEFKYKQGDGTIGTRSSGSAYGWGVASEFSSVDESTVRYLRQKVTKNGIV